MIRHCKCVVLAWHCTSWELQKRQKGFAAAVHNLYIKGRDWYATNPIFWEIPKASCFCKLQKLPLPQNDSSGCLPVWSYIFKRNLEVVFLLQHWADIPGIAKGCKVQPNSGILFMICVVMLAYVFFGVQSTVIANNPSISFLKISTTPASPIPQESGHIALMFFLWVVWDICSSDCQQEVCQISNRGANGTGKQNQTKTYYEHVRTVLPYVCLLWRHDKPRKSKDLYWKGGDMKYEYGSAAVVKWFDMSKAG